MATLNDLLNNFGLGNEDEVGEEKVASDNADEQALLESLLSEKTASFEGENEMGSLADLYMHLSDSDEQYASEYTTEDDFDKVAQAAAEIEEVSIVKVAAEYDAAGRIMARGFMDEFSKLAAELEEASKAKTPALGERGTKFQVPTNYVGKGQLATKGGQSANAGALKGDASADSGAEKAMGPQFATVKSMMG